MRYALLLRGINVGGKNKVVMADLKKDLAELGFENPVSYINSGNLFFESEEQEERIREILSAYFSRSYDFPLPFVLVSSAMLEKETGVIPSLPERVTVLMVSSSTIVAISLWAISCLRRSTNASS